MQQRFDMFIYLLILTVLICVVHFYFKCNDITRQIRKMPTPKEEFLIGNARELITTPVELFNLARIYANRFNGIYGWWSFLLRSVNVYSPEDIEIVISSSKNAEKSQIYNILHPWLNEGLLVSAGKKWLHRRKILTPAFHFNILKRYLVVMEENSQRLLEILQKTKGEAVNVIPIISEYTLSAICESAMGTQLQDETSNEAKVYKNAIYKLGLCMIHRMSRIFYVNDFIFNLSTVGRAQRKYLKIVQDFTKKIIKERKQYIDKYGITFSENMEDDDDDHIMGGRKKKVAMLDLMISAEKEGVIDMSGVQEEVDTFMFEGHDTTAAGLNYCLMLLANHKYIQDKILSELKDVFGDTDRRATIEDLNSLRYLECCIKESLRLYPPVPFIGRTMSETVVLSGYTIPAGVQCHIHIYDLHRRADLYKDPNKFDPDRFLPENSVGRHPYAYIPFSAGPRNCIGQRFALLEMKSCISAVLRKFELQPVTTPDDLEFSAHLVLKNTNPVYVKFVERIAK